jgi:hypothetical protein
MLDQIIKADSIFLGEGKAILIEEFGCFRFQFFHVDIFGLAFDFEKCRRIVQFVFSYYVYFVLTLAVPPASDTRIELASYMVKLGLNISYEEAHNMVVEAIKNKKAYNKLLEFIKSEGDIPIYRYRE